MRVITPSPSRNQWVITWPGACDTDVMKTAGSRCEQPNPGRSGRRPVAPARLRRNLVRWVCRSALTAAISVAALSPVSADFDAELDLEQHDSGGLYLSAEVASGVDAPFLLDTGASMVTLTRELINAARAQGGAHPAGAIAARLANGRLQKMDVWQLDHLWVGGCDVGPLEVAVVPNGRNILGLNALSRMAPFAIHLSPLKLKVSGCAVDIGATPIAARF